MRITVVTAFPQFFRSFLDTSIVGRAVERGLLNVSVVDLREYGEGDYRQIDDYSFGGNGGMVIMAEPLSRALEDLDGPSFVVYPSPQGVTMTQEMVESLSTKDHLVIVCGHYEGVDERFVQSKVDMELSIGDYVLTGGELPAMVVIDSVSRLIPGVVGKGRAVVEDSFYRGMLDNPHFTRPAEWRGMEVPPVLLSGNDSEIDLWRRREAVVRTLDRRADLLCRASLRNYLEVGYYVMWFPPDELDPWTLRTISLSCSSYGVSRLLIPVQDGEVREGFRSLISDLGLDASVKLFPSAQKASQWVLKKEKKQPFSIAIGKGQGEENISWLEVKREILSNSRPPMFVFGENVASEGDVTMRPVAGDDRDRSALPVQNAVSVVLDRFFGWR
ncbi:MAG: tRNA (guanosine(37)-N1)-methyltransferase TrmD [Synergistales bacterium]|nr:tRNA (guanosine(37)-N1)-methyltransferase TrmD [Dethiosulfovibrio sp.]NCC95648.1 tRNA (guanosine(37)-N1)-methyltransferase TrmD [Synergistales bacterium]